MNRKEKRNVKKVEGSDWGEGIYGKVEVKEEKNPVFALWSFWCAKMKEKFHFSAPVLEGKDAGQLKMLLSFVKYDMKTAKGIVELLMREWSIVKDRFDYIVKGCKAPTVGILFVLRQELFVALKTGGFDAKGTAKNLRTPEQVAVSDAKWGKFYKTNPQLSPKN